MQYNYIFMHMYIISYPCIYTYSQTLDTLKLTYFQGDLTIMSPPPLRPGDRRGPPPAASNISVRTASLASSWGRFFRVSNAGGLQKPSKYD